MAVGGYYLPSHESVDFAERSDGSRWSITPTVGSGANLTSVSCISAGACMAVGDYTSATGSQAYSERWNGSRWSAQPVPLPAGTGDSELFGVSCTAANACTAVGYYDGSSVSALVERWNGSAWSIQPSPNPPNAGETGLQDVSCTAANQCTAAGGYSSGAEATLVERWNGTAWTIESSPNPGSQGNQFLGVSCIALRACTAVGWRVESANGSNVETTLAEGWNGLSWSVEATPSTSGYNSGLVGVSCVAASWCQAIGSATPSGSGTTAPIAEIYAASATPSLSTTASPGVVLGGQVHDTATISGGQSPTSYLHFKLYGPNDQTCSRPPVFATAVKISGDGSYSSGSFEPTQTGTYRFIASYSGDANNNPVSGACGAPGEQVTVT
jgi:hypothetical protein